MNVQLSLFDTEQWRDVPDFEGLYRVSDRGRVFNTTTQKIFGYVPPKTERHITTSLRKCGQTYHFGVHRLVMLAFVGECPIGMEVHHKNHIKYDNRLENLEYITHQQNVQHAADLGLLNKRNPDTKTKVRELYDLNWQSSDIAFYLGVSPSRVQQILADFGISARAEKPRRPAYEKRETHVAPRSVLRKHILKMYRDGIPPSEIAHEAGISRVAVSDTLRYWLPKEERRNKKRTNEEAALNRQRIHELASQGHTIKAISEITNTHYNFVYKVLRLEGNQ